MKKKIGEIYNKPIVTGDKNLVTKNEIHESTLNGGSGASGEAKERWVSIDISAINPGPLEFKDFSIYEPTELGHRILNELCDMFIGWAAIPYTSGNGYSISGGTMNVGELNNKRKGVDSEGREDKSFRVRAFKFREVSNSNKFIDIVGGLPQHPYEGGLGNLDTLAWYPILLNHSFWNDKNEEERLFLTIILYNTLVLMLGLNEDTIINDLYTNNITIEDLFIQNNMTEVANALKLIYVNKEEELNKTIEYMTNYNGRDN
jgi:hypothetical protein